MPIDNEDKRKEHNTGYPEYLKIKPGDLTLKCLKKGKIIFRASRNDELPTPCWFEKEIERFTEQNKEEWSGRYFFLTSEDNETPTIKDIEAYASDYVDESTSKGVYRLEQREIKEDLYVIVNNNRNHGTCAIVGDIKALAIKDFFKENGLGSVNNDEDISETSFRLKEAFSDKKAKLLPVLDSLGLAYKGPHTEEEGDELILGPNALKKVKPKDITQVLAFDCNEEDESPKEFLQNTNLEIANSVRTRFISKYVKQEQHFPKKQFQSQEENLDLVQILQPDPDIETIFIRAVLQNQCRFLMTETSPVKIVKDVAELVRIGVKIPSELRNMLLPANPDEEHVTSKLAEVVAKGGMAPLAEAWISLLNLLHEQYHLSGEEIVSFLLPHIKRDSRKSLAHAIAGSAWSSEAATKLCAFLSKLARSNEQLRKQIIECLSMKQYGYNFKMQVLNRYSDFYKRAKRADRLRENTEAIVHLAEGKLIPKNRKLYKRIVPGTKAADINWDCSVDKLQKRITDEIVQQVKATYENMAKENFELERAKISTRERLGEINCKKKEEKDKTLNEMIEGLNLHLETQALIHDQSKEEKTLYQEQRRAIVNEDTEYSVGGAASIVMPIVASALSNHVERTTDTPYYNASGAYYNHEYVRNDQKSAEIQKRLDSLRASSTERSLENRSEILKGFNIDRSLEKRLDSLRQFNTDWALEKRLDSLRGFNTDLALEKRLKNLRSSGDESKRKLLTPALRAD